MLMISKHWMAKMKHRFWSSGLAVVLVAACTAIPTKGPGQSPVPSPVTLQSGQRAVLAPTGVLRVGVYLGSPTSLVVDAQGQRSGVAYEMGQALGRSLGVPVSVVEYRRVAEVVEALRTGQVDFTVTNASPARAQLVNFAKPMISLELGYLVPSGGKIQNPSDIDRSGTRVGVSEGSSSQAVLERRFQQAKVLPVASLKLAAEGLQQGALDVFATNKAILYELSDSVPGSRILEGRWGLEQMAIAIPKGREDALPELDVFAQKMRSDGSLAAIVQRAGLRGTAAP
jgi:polar amino acid transport system substrate-binding protein